MLLGEVVVVEKGSKMVEGMARVWGSVLFLPIHWEVLLLVLILLVQWVCGGVLPLVLVGLFRWVHCEALPQVLIVVELCILVVRVIVVCGYGYLGLGQMGYW